MLEATPKEVDFVIVGGGLAGLSAALTIGDANTLRALQGEQPLTFVVLESSGRLGGRTFSPDPALDFGGGYIGSTQTYVQYLLRRYAALKAAFPETKAFDIPTTKEFLPNEGIWLYEDSKGGPLGRYPGDDPLNFPGGANGVQCLGALDAWALLVRNHLERPWDSPLTKHPHNFDAMTVQKWIDLQVEAYDPATGTGMSPETMEAFVASVRSAFSLEPRELSFFFLLYYAATAGTYSDIVDVAGGDGAAEATRFLFGTQSLIDAMVTEIGSTNIALNAKVATIADTTSEVTVTTTKQGSWKAKKVIVAMSPPISSGIEYTPPLGDQPGGGDRVALCNAMLAHRGCTIKGFVRFKDAYWRDPNRDRPPPGQGKKIRMGFMLSSANLNNDPANNDLFEKYPLDWTLDNVWEDDDGKAPKGEPKRYYLMTFIVGDSARYWAHKPLPERARAVIDHVKRIYGLTDSDLFNKSVVESNYSEVNWPVDGPSSDTAPGGLIPAPDSMMGPNTLSKYGWALRVPVGNIHWAGSESATEWTGYMNGAIQSGFRAAGEVLGFVKPLSHP